MKQMRLGGSTMVHVEKAAEHCEDACCAPPPLVLPSKPMLDRRLLIREAFRLEWLTIGWMVVEAVVARAGGLPLYVRFVIQDLLAEEHRVDALDRHLGIADALVTG